MMVVPPLPLRRLEPRPPCELLESPQHSPPQQQQLWSTSSSSLQPQPRLPPQRHHRFVPLDESLKSDAPGYNNDADARAGAESSGQRLAGPVCWKCHGSGCHYKDNNGRGPSSRGGPASAGTTTTTGTATTTTTTVSSAAVTATPVESTPTTMTTTITTNNAATTTTTTPTIKTCTICHGSGRLPVRTVVPRPGKVTRGRNTRNRGSTSRAAAPPPTALLLGVETTAAAVAAATPCSLATGSAGSAIITTITTTTPPVVRQQQSPELIVPPPPSELCNAVVNGIPQSLDTAAAVRAVPVVPVLPTSPLPPPQPVGYQVPFYGALVQKATWECVDISITTTTLLEEEEDNINIGNNNMADPNAVVRMTVVADHHHDNHKGTTTTLLPLPPFPIWWPRHTNEELCNLVGEYRILQKYKSHRWTTDDLVTASIAVRTIQQQKQQQQQLLLSQQRQQSPQLRYCDLGTGNASVLQMVLYKCYDLLDYVVGVEARQEALGLARRSLAFNIGDMDAEIIDIIDDTNATAVECQDTEDVSLSLSTSPQSRPRRQRRRPKVCLYNDDFRQFPPATDPAGLAHSFDLVTGTPPYFAVQYSVNEKTTTTATTTPPPPPTAIIQQGAMPSTLQSAPARCEFRGGIDEYCAAAARLLKPTSTAYFVVCVNYLNHNRAVHALHEHHFHLETIWYIRGKVGRDRLFVVYVARRSGDGGDSATRTATVVEEREMSVRDEAGAWTDEYQSNVLRYMDIVD